MSLRTSFRVCIVALLCGVNVVPCRGRKNVLFLIADDMRPELGAYAGPNMPSNIHPKLQTPNIDQLARKSLLFERAYVQQALCSPSRTSLLTGRRPDTTRVYDLDSYFRTVGGNFTTIPQYFKENGYKTAGVGKIFHHGAASGYDDPISWTEPFLNARRVFEGKKKSWDAIPDNLLINNPLKDEQVANLAISQLQNFSVAANTTNFFLAVGFSKPHLPFVFPQSILQYYPEENISLPNNPYAPVNMPEKAWTKYGELRMYGDIKALNVSGDFNTTLPDAKVKELRRAYYSAVTWADMQTGRVLDELDRLGLANDTIVFFLGDHGFMIGEHGEWCKHSNFELATQTPLMVRVPGRTDQGIKTTQLVEFVDIFPTVVEAAGIPSLPVCPTDSSNFKLCHEGTSLLPLINNPNTTLKAAAFSQQPRGKTIMGYSIRTDKYRYTEWVRFRNNTPDWSDNRGTELYDHSVDRDENYNAVDNSSLQSVKLALQQALHAGWRQVSNNGSVLLG